MCRCSTKSQEQQHIRERAALESRQADARREANRKAEEERDAALAAAQAALAAAQAAQAQERREAEEAALMDRLRTAFMAANPNADDADWTKAKDRIREDHMVRMARVDPVEAEAGALMQRSPAGFRGPW